MPASPNTPPTKKPPISNGQPRGYWPGRFGNWPIGPEGECFIGLGSPYTVLALNTAMAAGLTLEDTIDLNDEPDTLNYLYKAGFIPKESWVHDRSEGGGRILGEVCHFVDLAQFLTGSLPIRVYAETLGDSGKYSIDENVIVTVALNDGSIASITYTANGDKSFPRERVEIFGGGAVCVIDNYKSLTFTSGIRQKKMTKFNKDSNSA